MLKIMKNHSLMRFSQQKISSSKTQKFLLCLLMENCWGLISQAWRRLTQYHYDCDE